MASVQVRYIVRDVDAAVDFYVTQLGFALQMHPAPAFAMLTRGELRLVLTAPNPAAGGGQPMPDGAQQHPGGWNRFAIEVADLSATAERLRAAGVPFRNTIVTGVGGKQVIIDDPSGNPVELFEPTRPEARLSGDGSSPRLRPNRSIPDAAVIPELAYPDVSAAVAWLCNVFGFEERLRIGDHRAQLLAGTGAIVVMDASREPPGSAAPSGHGVLVRVDGVDAHCARATAAGAEILSPPTTHPFGERQYGARDPGGHRWTFSETVGDVDPAAWGGSLVKRERER